MECKTPLPQPTPGRTRSKAVEEHPSRTNDLSSPTAPTGCVYHLADDATRGTDHPTLSSRSEAQKPKAYQGLTKDRSELDQDIAGVFKTAGDTTIHLSVTKQSTRSMRGN